jgi:hypothetical protein
LPTSRRFAADSRWSGVTRLALGHQALVVEDGLNGCPTDLADPTWPQITGAGILGCAARQAYSLHICPSISSS